MDVDRSTNVSGGRTDSDTQDQIHVYERDLEDMLVYNSLCLEGDSDRNPWDRFKDSTFVVVFSSAQEREKIEFEAGPYRIRLKTPVCLGCQLGGDRIREPFVVVGGMVTEGRWDSGVLANLNLVDSFSFLILV